MINDAANVDNDDNAPQVATCSYTRYARLGGGQEQKNAICILNLNMINDKVTAIYIRDMMMMMLLSRCLLASGSGTASFSCSGWCGSSRGCARSAENNNYIAFYYNIKQRTCKILGIS